MKFLKKKLRNEGCNILSKLEEVFNSEKINKKGRELEFVKRESKIDSYNFLMSNLLALDANGGGCSLSDINNELSMNYGVLSKNQSINERFNRRSVALSKWMLEEVMRKRLVNFSKVKCLNKFSSIQVQDSTGISLPDELSDQFKGFGGFGSAAGLKIDLRMDLLSTDFHLRIKEATDNDQNGLTFGVEKNSLWIRDLGYFKYKDFRMISNQGGYFLSRLQNGSNAYLDSKSRSKSKIELLSLADELAENEQIDRWVYLGFEKRWPVRIVIFKLPKHVADRRKKKMIKYKKIKRKKYSEILLNLLKLNIFITNIPKEKCSAEEIMELYTIRWQIEILFKGWKTNYEIDDLKENIKGDRALTQFYLHLILIIITTTVFRFLKLEIWKRNRKELSEIKGLKIIKKWTGELLRKLLNKNQEKEKILRKQVWQMFYQVINNGAKNSSKKNISKLFYPKILNFDIC